MGGPKTTTTPVKSTTTATQSLSPEQQQLMNLVMPIATNYANNPPQLFPGSTIAPPDPLQTQGQNQALSIANTALPQINQTANQAFTTLAGGGSAMTAPGGNVSNAVNFLTDPKMLDPSTNPYLMQSIQAAINPITEQFTTAVLPNIRSGAVSAGQYGSSRQGVVDATASQNYLRQVGDTSATMASNAYNTGLGAMISGAGLGAQLGGQQNAAMSSALGYAPTMANMALAPAQVTAGVGDARQAYDQALLTEQANRYLAQQMMPFTVAQDIAQLAFGIPAGQTTTNSVGSQITQSGGQAGQIIGGVGSLALSAAAIF